MRHAVAMVVELRRINAQRFEIQETRTWNRGKSQAATVWL